MNSRSIIDIQVNHSRESLLTVEGLDSYPDILRCVLTQYWSRLQENPQFTASGLQQLLDEDPAYRVEMLRVWAASDFVANSTITDPQLLVRLHAGRSESSVDYVAGLRPQLADLTALDFESANPTLKQRLRSFHRYEFVAIIWRDICEYLDVYGVCAQMSQLASACLQCSLEILEAWGQREWGVPEAAGVRQSLVVIGMGKLGAGELNVSSDIDLIFAYSHAGEVRATGAGQESLSNQQYFTRVGQRLIDALDAITADGFVFRVDMRLRPYGSEGALVQSFDSMEDYYQNQGRDWERYALIKARAVAGDLAAGAKLIKRLQPFIYRRYLDFAMFESLRDMKLQINKQARREKPGGDIKLGVGGIREVEFIIQALQLVHGGRDRMLQQPSITEAMTRLVSGDYLPSDTVAGLRSAYGYLRKLEHRLQAVANQQTQKLPTDNLARARVAHAMGCSDWETLEQDLQQHVQRVARDFRLVLHVEGESQQQSRQQQDWSPIWKLELGREDVEHFLARQGFEVPAGSVDLLEAFRNDRRVLVLPPESRRRLDLFMPLLLAAVSRASHPSLCLSRVLPLIEAVSGRTAYLVLLMENPAALEQLVLYSTASPLISEYLTKFPVLLDELLDVLDSPPDKSVLADELRLQLLRVDESNLEEQLECLRYFKQSHLLQVAAAEVSGKMHLMKVSDYLTFTAEVILDAVLSLAWQYLVTRHGYPVHADGTYGKPDFVIVGYGKLGGIELSYNSDLDLVFLHRADLEADTITDREDQQTINSRAFYIKLAQRIMVILGTYTMSGKLYEVDVRLRPSGESGLLVSSLESYADYQQQRAWTWEHQALVRARGVAGNQDLIDAFARVRSQILAARRDTSKLADDVVTMRKRMRDELSADSTSATERLAFSIKQGGGGIVDVEFLVQFLVLAYSCDCDALLEYTDNFRILEAASACRILDSEDMRSLIDAYLALRAASHQLALQRSDALETLQELQQHQAVVSGIWKRVFPEQVKP